MHGQELIFTTGIADGSEDWIMQFVKNLYASNVSAFVVNQGLYIKTIPEEYGIEQSEFEKAMSKMAEDALASGSPANTIKEVTKENIIEIYKRLW